MKKTEITAKAAKAGMAVDYKGFRFYLTHSDNNDYTVELADFVTGLKTEADYKTIKEVKKGLDSLVWEFSVAIENHKAEMQAASDELKDNEDALHAKCETCDVKGGPFKCVSCDKNPDGLTWAKEEKAETSENPCVGCAGNDCDNGCEHGEGVELIDATESNEETQDEEPVTVQKKANPAGFTIPKAPIFEATYERYRVEIEPNGYVALTERDLIEDIESTKATVKAYAGMGERYEKDLKLKKFKLENLENALASGPSYFLKHEGREITVVKPQDKPQDKPAKEEKFRICVEKVIDGHPKTKNLQDKNGNIWFKSIADAVACLEAKNAHYLKHSQWMLDIHGYHVWAVFNEQDEIVCAN